MKSLKSYLKYRHKLNDARMAFNSHILTPEMLKDINSIIKGYNGQSLNEVITDVNRFQYEKLMGKHFKNLQEIDSLQEKSLSKEEQEFVQKFGLDNDSLKSAAIYMPNGQVLTDAKDKEFIRTLVEAQSYMVVNAAPHRVEIQIKEGKSTAKITASNPIENRHKNPTITTDVTRGNVTVVKRNIFDNTYYDVFKADPKSANVADFITEEKTVNNINKEVDEHERG